MRFVEITQIFRAGVKKHNIILFEDNELYSNEEINLIVEDWCDNNLTNYYQYKWEFVDDKKIIEQIKNAVEKVCARHQPLKMKITGSGKFAKGEDGTPVFLIPNAKGLSLLQADLEEAISNIIDLPSVFGWVPHMTLGYSKEDLEQLKLNRII